MLGAVVGVARRANGLRKPQAAMAECYGAVTANGWRLGPTGAARALPRGPTVTLDTSPCVQAADAAARIAGPSAAAARGHPSRHLGAPPRRGAAVCRTVPSAGVHRASCNSE